MIREEEFNSHIIFFITYIIIYFSIDKVRAACHMKGEESRPKVGASSNAKAKMAFA
jgi:hypothetical protein